MEMSVTLAAATTIQVPQDQPTIQGAIDAAQDGDLVLVSPGIYNERLTIANKTITLASQFHTTNDEQFIGQTVIDGNGLTVITVDATVGPETKIIGFTIQNGEDGISAHAKLYILNNRFTGHSDAIDYESGGGGICRDNLFENNSDDAVDLDGSVAAIIEDNIIRNNGDDGIEIRLHRYSGPTLDIIIRNNTISGNDEDGIQLIDYSDLSDRVFHIERNLFENNAMVGLGLMDNGDTVEDFRAASIPERIHLYNNTFINNPYGVTGGDNLIALNNLFVNSTNIALKEVDGGSIVAYNLFWNNGIDNQGSNIDSKATLFVDPLLESDYRLQPDSPAIDTGTAQYTLGSGETVLDLPASAYAGSDPDLGMFESNFAPDNPAPTATISTPTTGASFNLGESIAFTGSANDPEDGDITVSLVWVSDLDGTIGVGRAFARTDLSVGTHTITATATDSDNLSGQAQIVLTVNGVGEVSVLEVRVAAGGDDAEEQSDGSVDLKSSDLELIYDHGDQTVGMRFNGVALPQGAHIANAYIKFEADETHLGATPLTIHGEATDNADSFSSANGNISSRPKTSAAASWEPLPWTMVGEVQRTTNIAHVIEEIVNRPGWTSGNSLVLIVTGTGERSAKSYNGDAAGAPLLYIENQAPTVTISAPADGTNFDQGESVSFSGNTSDAEDGDVTASLVWVSDLDGTIGAGGAFARTDLSVGLHTITATATDSSGLSGQAQLALTVLDVSVDAAVLVGAGDISICSNDYDLETSLLLDDIDGTVFTLGDNVYPDGTDAEFNDCYDPTWGRHKARTRPSAGNHDYNTPAAAGYFNYFGLAAGDPDKGYYSYDVGDWHIIVLNTNCSEVGGCESDSVQGQWLQADLAANQTDCTLAYWHSPRFSSGARHGGSTRSQDFWQILYDVGADVVLSGHEHSYERFAPQDPSGVGDPEGGIREFVVGTGGKSLYSFGTPEPNSEVRENNTYGVLKLTLHPTAYDWEFIPIAGQTFTDSGSASCVGVSHPNQAPTVTVSAPADGANFGQGESITFTGSANDPEDGDVTATLAWVSSIDGNIGTNGSFARSDLSVGMHTITATATDSDSLSGQTQISLTINGINSAPTVTVSAPADDASFDQGESITFTGGASDPEDGDITATLVWDSSIDGNIGTNGSFARSDLSVGIHTITATATDSGALSGQTHISLTIDHQPNYLFLPVVAR